MPFPNISPTARSFTPGDFPIKQYKALSGAEIRIRYGNLRIEASLDLTYENIRDDVAAQFLAHYSETQGTFLTFGIAGNVFAGWDGSSLNAPSGTQWRYAQPPDIQSVYRGLSTVKVVLVAVA
jgi:hypothetical protein